MEQSIEQALNYKTKDTYLKYYLKFCDVLSDEDIKKITNKEIEFFLALEGPGRFFKCKEEFRGVNISDKLDTIRSEPRENVLLLAFKEGSIVDEIQFEGESDSVSPSDYVNNGAFDFIKKWIKEGAVILNYHNHSHGIAARPSKEDILRLSINTDLEKELVPDDYQPQAIKLLKDNDLGKLTYADWGVVTDFDFFSSSQKQDILLDLFNETTRINDDLAVFVESVVDTKK